MYTNIDGRDDDINVGFLARISPHQRRRGLHRFQHVYLWILYAFLPMKWQLVDDFYNVATGRIAGTRMARPKGWNLGVFVAGKAFFFFFALVLPMLLHPFWVVIALYALACFVLGVVLSVVFQLAHIVEEASFPQPDLETGRLEASFAEHQLSTTVDFARGNRLLSWYVGGLNFQIEHHLFPRVCHVHYPKIARLVERSCRKAGIEYLSNPSVRVAIASHYRWLKAMGRRPAPSGA
jgi:linoleoyl-CoA desaturase